MITHLVLIASLLLGSLSVVNAQFYLTGQDAARTRWYQLSTTHFRLIFPEAFANQAQKTAQLLEAAYPAINAGLGAKAVKTDVVLHNQNSVSNALVAWAPRRMDFFHVPPQDGYSQDWMSQLVLHELRHVAQMRRLETGFSRGLRMAFGQQATGAIAGLFLPNWFMEGDAVWAETYLSHAGRGRSPLFSAGLRAQLTEKGIYAYEKAWFGSYRDFTPDIYELGYHIVAYNGLKYGSQLWENTVELSAHRPWQVYPFSISLRKQTGMGVGKLYRATMDSLTRYWNAQQNQPTKTWRITPARKSFTNYRYPQLTPHGLVAFRSSYDDLSRIVLIDSLGERVLFTPNYLFPEGFAAKNDLVVWNEYQPDLRWSNKAYSVIKLLNLKNHSVSQLSYRSYYYAPHLNNAGNSIAVSEVKPDGSSAIVLLDVTNGQKLSEYRSEKYFLHQPKWLADDEHIAFLATGPAGKSIWLLNLPSMRAEQYTPFTTTDFHLSSAGDGVVYLHGAWRNQNEAFVFDFATRQLSRLTVSTFAATDPQMHSDSNTLVFASYSADGWYLASSKVDLKNTEKFDFAEANTESLLGFSLPADRFTLDRVPLNETQFAVKPYRRGKQLFKLHSWAPFFVDAATQEIRPGLSLMSQNSLSTMTATLGYDYDIHEKAGKSVLKMTYLGLFPVIDFTFSKGLRRSAVQMNNQTYALRWDETSAGLQLSVPLNFTRSRWQRGAHFSVGTNLIRQDMHKDVGLNFKQEYTSAINYNLLIYNLDRLKRRDIFPRTGQVARIIFRHSPFDATPGKQLFASAISYFPGIVNHHGLRLYTAMQRENKGYYNFGTYVSMPRGLTGPFNGNMKALKIDYAFPVAYPDQSFGPVIYTKRLRTNVFYDLLATPDSDYSSLGFELWADVHLLRMQAPVGIGFRLSYNLPQAKMKPEIIFGIDWNAVY